MRIILPAKTIFKKNKSVALILMLFLGVFTSSVKAQYCSTFYSSGTGSGDYISLVEFVGTSLNNSSAGASSPYYTFFPNSGATTTTLSIGMSYTLNVGGGTYSTCYISMWGDWNQDGIFSTTEFMGVSPNVGSLSTASFPNVMIPYSALAGTTRIRFRSSDQYPGPGAADACNNTNSSYGETEDYEITLIPLPSCSGTPYAGNASATSVLVCANTSFGLDLLGNTLESGITYQWQSSPDGSIWTSMGTSQTGSSYYINGITQSLLYRCITTCTSTGQADTSTVTNVNLNPLINCYCMPYWPNYMVDCTQDSIAEFSIANVVSQNTNCDAYGFTDSTMSNYTTINLSAGNSYVLSATSGLSGLNGNGIMGAWIDYNQNAIFDNNEYTCLGFGASGTYTANVNVPFTVPGGSVRMRLKLDAAYASSSSIIDPCASGPASVGQILDYKVNITAAPACSLTPNAGIAVSTMTNVCENTPYTLDLAGNDAVSGITYQWQTSLNGTSWTNIGAAQNTVQFAVSSQSTTTYYQCVLTCTNSANSATSTPVIVVQNLPTTCYCIPDYVTCANGAQMTNVTVAGVSYTPVCNAGDNYYDLTTTPSMSLSLTAAQSYTISTTIASPYPRAYVGAWLDYDQNGVFDASEFMYVGDSVNGTITMPFTVPFTSLGGNTRLRLKMESVSSIFSGLDPCISHSSEGTNIDYLVNIIPAAPCSGTPNAGDATASYTAICSNTTLKLDLVNNDMVSNISYQWQYSEDNVAWFNLGTAQPYVPYEITSQTVTTHYRCITTCTTSAQSSTSTPVSVTQNPLLACYCIPGPMNCTSDDINYVSLATLTNTSSCGTDGYEDFTGTVASATISAGQSYTLTTVLGYMYSEHVSVWIDYDQNGTFDSGEYTYIGNNSGNDTIAGSITIPVSAAIGTTKMRVRNMSGQTFNPNEACISPSGGGFKQMGTGFIPYGETEDYLVTIMPPDCGIVNIPNAISAFGSSVFCSVQSATLNLAPVLPLATGFSYNWMSSNGGPYVSEGISTSTTSINVMPSSTSYYYCDVMCNGSSVLVSDTIAVVVDIVTASVTSSNVACFGSCNGSASVTAVTGSGPYIYSWSPVSGTTAAITGLCAGTYSVSLVDINGCSTVETVIITEPTAIVATSSQTNVSCYGLTDGMASVSVTGGIAPLSFSWSPIGGNGSTATNLAPGTYTFHIQDANNCLADQFIAITQPGVFSASISGSNSSICEQLEDTLKSNITGGNAPYSYSWTELPSTTVSTNASYEYTTSVGTHSYNLTVIDANNCTAISNTLNISVNPSSNFSGMVTTNTTIPVAGRVILYKYLPFYTKFDSVAGQNIAPNGSFLFNSFTSGTYIIKAVPTATNLQVAYGDAAVNWKTATQIHHGCAVNDVQNIEVKALGTLAPGGTGLLSGFIFEGLGYDSLHKTASPGTPIGGIVVKGGKNPGGQMFVQTVTDSTGKYELPGLPQTVGNESYFVLVDIPGLDTNSTYRGLIINVSNNEYTNLNFVVDSAKINPISSVSVNDISAKEHAIKVFPNPASNYVTIQYDLQHNSQVKIELFDILGKTVKTFLPSTEQGINTYKNTWSLDDLKAGMYFIKININGKESTIKLSVSN